MPRTSNKREKLLAAARELIHQQGYRHTTLAEIAQRSEVPLGNVYYYFKTKDDLAAAVIKEHLESITDQFNRWEADIPIPRARIEALLDYLESMKDMLAEAGCPIGSLCQELSKDDGSLAEQASNILTFQLDWVERQIAAMGHQNARTLATELVTNLQGISLIANSLNDADMVSQQVARLRRWLAGI
jgi:TetR/AcrR family transcriptional repressor of nem operon